MSLICSESNFLKFLLIEGVVESLKNFTNFRVSKKHEEIVGVPIICQFIEKE